MVSRYSRWAAEKIKSGQNRSNPIDLGDTFVFGYQPDKSERDRMPDQDIMPVFIILQAYSSRVYGVNVIGLPHKRARIAVLDKYREALETKSQRIKMRSLYDIRRLVSTSYRPAYVSYKWANIKTRVAKLTVDDLDELARRIL